MSSLRELVDGITAWGRVQRPRWADVFHLHAQE